MILDINTAVIIPIITVEMFHTNALREFVSA